MRLITAGVTQVPLSKDAIADRVDSHKKLGKAVFLLWQSTSEPRLSPVLSSSIRGICNPVMGPACANSAVNLKLVVSYGLTVG